MIEATELRIGNWVFDINKEPIQIESLSPIKHPYRYRWEWLKVLEPIPLTKEWLLKFGANKRKIGDSCYSYDLVELEVEDFFHLEISDKGYLILECEDSYYSLYLKHLKYVHHLQNFYRDLKGEELIIICRCVHQTTVGGKKRKVLECYNCKQKKLEE